MICSSLWPYISLIIALVSVSGGMFLVSINKSKMAGAVIFLPMVIWFIFTAFSEEENVKKLKCQVAQNIGAIFSKEIRFDQEVIDVKYQVVDVKYTSDSYEMCYYKDVTNVACDQIYKNGVIIRESASREKYFVGRCDAKARNILSNCTEAFIYLPKEDIKKLLILK